MEKQSEVQKSESLEYQINHYKMLISHEEDLQNLSNNENLPSNTQNQKPLNKSRLGRLIMLMLKEGPKDYIIESIQEELNWTKEQTQEFSNIVQSNNNNQSLSQQWTNWLDQLISD